MRTAEISTAEIKNRGQLTIPKKIRDRNNLQEGQAVTLITIGSSVLITPKKLKLNEAREQIARIMKSANVSVEELLSGLDKERGNLFEETYTSKKC